MKNSFQALCEILFSHINSGESLSVSFEGENSLFTRFNDGKVRQTGTVKMETATLNFQTQGRTALQALTLRDPESLSRLAQQSLGELRSRVRSLPADPFQIPFLAGKGSHFQSEAPDFDVFSCSEDVIRAADGKAFTGNLSAGSVARGSANSLGQFHWFETKSFHLDYSLFHETGKAIKGEWSGAQWEPSQCALSFEDSFKNLQGLDLPLIQLKPGKYRCYLTPSSINEVAGMFNWHGFAESEIRQGESAFCRLRKREAQLASQIQLSEDFSYGYSPIFNERGEVTETKTMLVENGLLANTLINSRTAQEYGLVSNGANYHESIRSLAMGKGDLSRADILEELGEGVFVSNFHYLNWSDVPAGRITGMTRYAPMWVEGGKIKGPIPDMRFDASLYDFLGQNLVDLTDFQETFLNSGTYGGRHLGATIVPGALVNQFPFTL